MFPPRDPDIHNIVLRCLGRMWYMCDMSTDIQAQKPVSIISLTRSQPALALTFDCVSVAILLDVKEAALRGTTDDAIPRNAYRSAGQMPLPQNPVCQLRGRLGLAVRPVQT